MKATLVKKKGERCNYSSVQHSRVFILCGFVTTSNTFLQSLDSQLNMKILTKAAVIKTREDTVRTHSPGGNT